VKGSKEKSGFVVEIFLACLKVFGNPCTVCASQLGPASTSAPASSLKERYKTDITHTKDIKYQISDFSECQWATNTLL